MHADLDRSLCCEVTIHVIDVDHRGLAVRLAFGARHLTGAAADAALGVDEELFVGFDLGILHWAEGLGAGEGRGAVLC